MSDLELFIGNRNYSSWSLRAWLVLKAAGLEFDETLIRLGTGASRAELDKHSPSGKVPALRVGGDFVWDSLAIAEWAAENAPSLWPKDRSARLHARSSAAEMHSGFVALRSDMPMNIRGRFPGTGHSAGALSDIARVLELWRQARERFGGTFLYGDVFTVTDAMYAPVTTRLVTYGADVDADAKRYIEAVHAYEPMAAWIEASSAEEWGYPASDPSDPGWQGGPLATSH